MSQPTDPSTTDSAGQPWAGRHFSANEHQGDEGRAAPQLAAALERFAAQDASPDAVVDALREARLLIPLVTSLLEAGVNERGQRIDKSQELSIVTVAGRDGRSVLPVFSSVETMSAWDAKARPVPIEGRRVALAAVQEKAELIVLDPGSATEFVVRRPAVWAIGRGTDWVPPWQSPAVRQAFERSVADEPLVRAVELRSGDPSARGAGAELEVTLRIPSGLADDELQAGVSRLSRRWAAEETIATGVDSLAVRIESAAP